MEANLPIYWVLISSFFLSFAITFITIYVYKKLGWLEKHTSKDHPKHIHAQPVPRGGGIPIFLTIAAVSFFVLPLDKHLIGILSGALLLFIIGILDDQMDIHPYIRLIWGFLAATCVVVAGIGIAYISNPFHEEVIALNQPQIPIYLLGKVRTIWVLADIFAFLWIVGIMNFVNWSKGLDGQLPGTAAIAAIAIAVLSYRFSADITQWETGVLAIIVAGAYLGFLPWNFYPQKIMPGYGGGTLAGYFLAVLSILSTTKVGTLFIVLGIPLIDAGYVIFRRLLAGQSPVWGDTRHLHHTLLHMGWSKRSIALFYWIITAALGFIALNLNSEQKLYTIIVLIIGFGLFLRWTQHFGISSNQRDQDNG